MPDSVGSRALISGDESRTKRERRGRAPRGGAELVELSPAFFFACALFMWVDAPDVVRVRPELFVVDTLEMFRESQQT